MTLSVQLSAKQSCQAMPSFSFTSAFDQHFLLRFYSHFYVQRLSTFASASKRNRSSSSGGGWPDRSCSGPKLHSEPTVQTRTVLPWQQYKRARPVFNWLKVEKLSQNVHYRTIIQATARTQDKQNTLHTYYILGCPNFHASFRVVYRNIKKISKIS